MDTKSQVKVIDAKGRALGRVASEAAVLLRGKDLPDFKRELPPPGRRVEIINAGAIAYTAKKQTGKIYQRYSGYPGGLRELTLKQVLAKKGPIEPLRIAVRGMLPKNSWRDRLMKRLKITV
jgi:large subunit ribosomal protein L13